MWEVCKNVNANLENDVFLLNFENEDDGGTMNALTHILLCKKLNITNLIKLRGSGSLF